MGKEARLPQVIHRKQRTLAQLWRECQGFRVAQRFRPARVHPFKILMRPLLGSDVRTLLTSLHGPPTMFERRLEPSPFARQDHLALPCH
jgi:hypothetical protein